MQAKLMQRLHLDHGRMAKVLTATEQLAKDMRRAELRPYLDKLLCVLEYVNEYPEKIHHPFEDKLFEHLLACNITPEERQQVVDNAARHQEMAAQSAALLESISRPLKAQKLTELRAALSDFVNVQREHMRFEESTVFPMAERYLDASVWEALDTDYVIDCLNADMPFDRYIHGPCRWGRGGPTGGAASGSHGSAGSGPRAGCPGGPSSRGRDGPTGRISRSTGEKMVKYLTLAAG